MSLNPENLEAIWESFEAMSSNLKESVSLIRLLKTRVEMQERYIDGLKGKVIEMEHRLKFLESGGKYPIVPVGDRESR